MSFNTLIDVYKSQDDNDEAQIVCDYLNRIHYTLECLRNKYLYPDDDNVFRLDAQSGFPNDYEIFTMGTDLKSKNEVLDGLRSVKSLKRDLVNYLLKYGENPLWILQELSKRFYLEMLNEDKVFSSFNYGNLKYVNTLSNGNRLYTYYWAVYNSENSSPCIYIMTFESSHAGTRSGEDLVYFEDNKEYMTEFLKVIRNEGSRSPKLNILAQSIDSELPNIHPKILRRITIGPFYTLNPLGGELREGLSNILKYGDEGNRFVLFVENEVVFSKDQTIREEGGLFSTKKKVREIYYVPEEHTDLYEKGISEISREVIIPHKIHQHSSNSFDRFTVYSFNKNGGINGL